MSTTNIQYNFVNQFDNKPYRTLKEGNDIMMINDVGAVSFSTIKNPREDNRTNAELRDSFNWTDKVYNIGDYAIFPYGDYNNLPDVIRDVVSRNYIAPGLLTKKRNLLWGNGPKLYKEVFDGDLITRELVRDKEIEHWLNSFDYKDYLLRCLKDYNYIEATTTRIEQGKGFYIGENFISKLVHVPANRVRAAAINGSDNHIEGIPTHVIVNNRTSQYFVADEFCKVYPLFDCCNPTAHANSIMYSNEYSFGIDFYTLPDIFGALEWLRRSTATPLILKSFTDNSINLKFHVESPDKYWDNKRNELKKKCQQKNIPWKEEYMKEYERAVFEKITEVLSGAENAGKMWHTVRITDTDGNNLKEFGWTIKAIDQNVKDFISAQIDVSKRADYAVGAAVGLHSALGNISESGKSDSGSEQLYAHQTYLSTNINVPEEICCKAINTALRVNFPDADVRIGFHHVGVRRQQDESSKDRAINQ